MEGGERASAVVGSSGGVTTARNVEDEEGLKDGAL